jgi:hypothetical protein
MIRDSVCFLPMALAQLPAAFNIQEMKKGILKIIKIFFWHFAL